MSTSVASRVIPALFAAWLAYVALDFLMHSVLLAAWWRGTGEYWLPEEELFTRIPYGYGSFMIYCIALTWLPALISIRWNQKWCSSLIKPIQIGRSSNHSFRNRKHWATTSQLSGAASVRQLHQGRQQTVAHG